MSGSPYGANAIGIPSSSISTLRLRFGFKPRMPTFSLIATGPESSRTLRPGTRRKASLASIGFIETSSCWLST